MRTRLNIQSYPDLNFLLLHAAFRHEWDVVKQIVIKFPDVSFIEFPHGMHRGKNALWLMAQAGQWDLFNFCFEKKKYHNNFIKALNCVPRPHSEEGINLAELNPNLAISIGHQTILWFAIKQRQWLTVQAIYRMGAFYFFDTLSDEEELYFQSITGHLRSMSHCIGLAKVIPELPVGEVGFYQNDFRAFRSRPILKAIEMHDEQTLELKMVYCKIDNDGAREIAKFLRNNSSLLRLDLRHNLIMNLGLRALCEALESNTKLECLHLSNNFFTKEGAEALAKLISINKSINELSIDFKDTDLFGNRIYLSEHLVLAALRENKTIRKININPNPFTTEFDAIIQRNNAVHNLPLRSTIV